MKAMILAVGMTGLVAGAALGQVAQDVQEEIQAVEARLAELRQTAMRSPDTQAKRQAMMQAEKAYEAAVTNIPAIREIDAKLVEARTVMHALMKQRQEALRANAVPLAAVEQARHEASAACRTAMMGGEQAVALMQRRQELQRSLLAKPAVETVPTEQVVPAP